MPTWEDCERRAATAAIGREIVMSGYPIPLEGTQNIAAVIGTAVHAGAALLNAQNIQHGTVQSVMQAVELAIEDLENALFYRTSFDQITPNRETAEWQIRRLLRAYAEHAKTFTPVAVEQELEAQFTIDGMVITLTGHVDVLELRRLRDLKTGRGGRACGSQLGSYSLLARSHGYQIADIVEDALPRPKMHQECELTVARYDVDACERQAYSVLRRAARAIIDFRKRQAPENFMANPQSFACSPRWCSAFQTEFCRVHRMEYE